MPKRPDSLETLQLSHELLRRIPKGHTGYLWQLLNHYKYLLCLTRL